MSSVLIWDDELSGIRVEWQKHADIGPVGSDGFVQSAYAIGRASPSGRPLTKKRFLRDKGDALSLGAEMAQAFHAERFEEAFSKDDRFQCDELGIEVTKGEASIIVDSVVRGYAMTLTSRIAEVSGHSQAAGLVARLYVEAANMKWQLIELGRSGEFPATSARSLIDIQSDFDVKDFVDRRIPSVLGSGDIPAERRKAAGDAVRCRLTRWMWDGPLEQALSYGVTRTARPYEIRRAVREHGEYHHPALGLLITRMKRGGWSLRHVGQDGHEVLIGKSKKPDWAASVIGMLDRRCEEAKADLFASVLREDMRPDAETPLAMPGFSDWLATAVDDLELGYGALAAIPAPDEAGVGAGEAIIHALEHWMASDAFKQAFPASSRPGR